MKKGNDKLKLKKSTNTKELACDRHDSSNQSLRPGLEAHCPPLPTGK